MQSQLLEILGGELLQKESPLVYEALSKVTIYDKDMLSTCSEPGVLDVYLNTEELFTDEAGVGIFQRNGFLKSVPFVATVSKLCDNKTGRLVDTFNEYWENTTYNEIKRHSSTTLAKQASKNDLRLVTTFTWSEDGHSVREYTEEFSVAQFIGIDPIVTELSVTAPRAKNKKMTMVLYDREHCVTSEIDYHYTNVLLPDKKSAKVMMPFEGSLCVNDIFEIVGINTSVEPPQMCLILENGGTVPYGYNAKAFEKQLVISENGKKMTWKFNDDWNANLDLSHFNVKTVVNFSCQFTLDVQKRDQPQMRFQPIIMIASARTTEMRGSGAIEIEPITIQWGCLAKGTKITMADGSERAIEGICPQELVRTSDGGTTSVKEVISGREDQLVFLETFNDCTLSLTKTHPVKTTRGIVRARELTAADIICTANGESKIKSIYMQDYNDKVYSLVLDTTAAIFCNGIVTGDFAMQNNLTLKTRATAERTPLQIELSKLMGKK